MNVSFKANFITSTNVLQKNKVLNTWHKKKCSIIELDKRDSNDFNAIRELTKLWSVYALVNDLLSSLLKRSRLERHVYAITTQKKDFEIPDSSQILGITMVSKLLDSECYIDYLEVNPEYSYDNKDSKLKHIGTAILDFLKGINRNNVLSLCSLTQAKPFYIKNGFKEYPGPSNPDDLFYFNKDTKL